MAARRTIEMVRRETTSLAARPNAFRLPRPVPATTLLAIASRFEEVAAVHVRDSLHLVGVATGGEQIAAAVATRLKLIHPYMNLWVSSINLNKPVNIIGAIAGCPPGTRTIVIDNSITTGKTIHEVLKLLAAKRVRTDLVVKLVEYGDSLEATTNRYIESEHQVCIASLFRVDEVRTTRDPAEPDSAVTRHDRRIGR